MKQATQHSVPGTLRLMSERGSGFDRRSVALAGLQPNAPRTFRARAEASSRTDLARVAKEVSA